MEIKTNFTRNPAISPYHCTVTMTKDDADKYGLPHKSIGRVTTFNLWGYGGSLNGCGTMTLSHFCNTGFQKDNVTSIPWTKEEIKRCMVFWDTCVVKACEMTGGPSFLVAMGGYGKASSIYNPTAPMGVAQVIVPYLSETWSILSHHFNNVHPNGGNPGQVILGRVIKDYKKGTIYHPDDPVHNIKKEKVA